MNKVKGYRNMLNMTQKDLANHLGITKQAYSNKERGLNNFKDEEKKKIKQLLIEYIPNITIDEIFFD